MRLHAHDAMFASPPIPDYYFFTTKERCTCAQTVIMKFYFNAMKIIICIISHGRESVMWWAFVKVFNVWQIYVGKG